jgi:hypothetical protein
MSYKTREKYHQEEVKLLQDVFGEISKHPLYGKINIEFNRTNKKIIKEVLRDFIGEHNQYDTKYYNNLVFDCETAILNLDDLL